MDRDLAWQVFSKVTKRGWNLYRRGKSGTKVPFEELVQGGPTSLIKKDDEKIIFDLFPRVENPYDPAEVRAAMGRTGEPTIRVPSLKKTRGQPSGYAVAQFRGGDQEELSLRSGEEIYFAGICFEEGFIRLIAPTRTYMYPAAFLEALDTLQDLTAVPKKKEPQVSQALAVYTFRPLSRGRFRCNQTNKIVKRGQTKAYRRSVNR